MNIWCRFYIIYRDLVLEEEYAFLDEKEDFTDYAAEWSQKMWHKTNDLGVLRYDKDVLLPDNVIDELKEKYLVQIKNAEQMLTILDNHKKEYLLK